MNRRSFLKHASALGGGLVLAGPLHTLGIRAAFRESPPVAKGYGRLVEKGPELALPAEFNYQVIARQGYPMHDGQLTPSAFDGMGAFPGPDGTTILIRNHENRERAGEVPVIVPSPYDAAVRGGNVKLVVSREKAGIDSDGRQLYDYFVDDSFGILGGTSTNCAGGELPYSTWLTCEEIVEGPAFGPLPPSGSGATPMKHGYVFEIDATAAAPVSAVPIIGAGRFAHEAAAWHAGILYLTEDRNNRTQGGACFYRYVLDRQVGRAGELAATRGVLQALRLRDEFRADMDAGRVVGVAYDVEWVTIDEPDHDDDTDMNTARIPGRTPVRFQAQDQGAAVFDRQKVCGSATERSISTAPKEGRGTSARSGNTIPRATC
jgi:secreted PhoX family phosphatase